MEGFSGSVLIVMLVSVNRSYYQAWRDLTVEQTEIEKLEEEQACQSLFIIFSNAFGPGLLGLPVLSCNDLDMLGLFESERSSHAEAHQRT
jgi:hypothetical protein